MSQAGSSAPAAPAESSKKTPLIALIGNPNTGKSTVFNVLCGARQKVGNYPGVTVERRTGSALLHDAHVDIVDLPGLYSLRAVSRDEKVAADAAMGRLTSDTRPDLLLFVLDATNIKRNLFLFSQVVELGLPVIVVLTMTDLLSKEGIRLDIPKLAERLKVPVVPVIASDEHSYEQLREKALEFLHNPKLARPVVSYGGALSKAVERILSESSEPVNVFEALEALSDHGEDAPLVSHTAKGLADAAAAARSSLGIGAVPPSRIVHARYNWAEEVSTVVESRRAAESTFTDKVDAVFTHRLFGPGLFAGIMLIVFSSIYSGARPVMDVIEAAFKIASGAADGFLSSAPMLRSLVVDGVIGGAGSVVVFLPQIMILFGFVAVLEDSGYLARAAFLMDKLLGWTGLNGRSFIPMLSSFACAVPGVMASRVIPDERARITTVLVSPLMSCSARLPVYLLLIGAFIEPHYGSAMAALALFVMHAFGILVALPIAYILNRGVLKTPPMPFLLEMPPYRIPQWRNVFFQIYEASRKFMSRAGTIIFAMSIVIWALSYFPRPESVRAEVEREVQAELAAKPSADREAFKARAASEIQKRTDTAYLEQSFLGRAGRTLEPVFAPLGYDWKITIGILSAFPARETIIATFGIIYAGDADSAAGSSLREKMAQDKRPDGRPVYTPLVAVSLMVFFALCCQCMSTVTTVGRELNSWKWAAFLFVYMTTLAYIAALAVYQIGIRLGA
ncbi:MAG: ferrous iron transport protein B [Spirochaetia bacterium]|nr:ferrous iron transport protein B [Spirochaetia bacterium]